MRRGIWYSLGAYGIWGLLPLYWHVLDGVPALNLIGHRVVWSCVLLALALLVTRGAREFLLAISSPRVLLIYAAAAVLVGVNWSVYVWAVQQGFVVETSLGYFINPLISVLFGVALLKERLRPLQWGAVGLAAAGVIYLTLAYGSFPWIALTLAVTFALYGLVKKLAPLGSVQGLALETGILFLPAIAYLVAVPLPTTTVVTPSTAVLLAGTGVATTVPLLLFSSAARRIPLVWVGIMQYIAPTIQFILGITYFHEAMPLTRLAGFVAVWVACVVFAVEGVRAHRASLVPATTD